MGGVRRPFKAWLLELGGRDPLWSGGSVLSLAGGQLALGRGMSQVNPPPSFLGKSPALYLGSLCNYNCAPFQKGPCFPPNNK